MAKFYISDLHFFDKKVIRSANRPHKSLKEMHTDMIVKWNKKVSKNDTVYILGDIASTNNLYETKELIKILKCLNGKKVLVIGNHDRKILNNNAFRSCFVKIEEYIRTFDNKKKVILFHFPIEDWESKKKGAIHLHGHIHKKEISHIKNRFHVGCDVQRFTPLTLDEIINKK